MANMDKAHKRIEQFYRGELSQYSAEMRAALGRRLEVDARFRAITNYLEELTYGVAPPPVEGTHLTAGVIADAVQRMDAQRPHAWNNISPGLAGSGLLGDLPEAAPGDVPPTPLVGSPGRTGEVCGCNESKALRLCLRRALDDFYGEADDWTDQASELLGDARRSKLDNLEDLVRELRPQAEQTKQAHAERDRAASAIAKARAVCLAMHVAPDPSPPALAESIRELAIALQEYDAEEIPF